MMYVDDGSMMDVDTSCMKSMDLYMMYRYSRATTDGHLARFVVDLHPNSAFFVVV